MLFQSGEYEYSCSPKNAAFGVVFQEVIRSGSIGFCRKIVRVNPTRRQ